MKMFDADKNRMIGLPYSEKNYDDMLSHFHLIPERNGETDGEICYNIACQYARQYARSAIKTTEAGVCLLHTGNSSMLTALRNGTESGLSTIICSTLSASCCHVTARSVDVPR